MLNGCQDDEGEEVGLFANAVKAKGEPFLAESFYDLDILLKQ